MVEIEGCFIRNKARALQRSDENEEDFDSVR